ncbi:hypothetical protein WMF39_10795 [Sorangium sp. So ce1504]|uniref:hypothetical protein n=1 Tax=Sorangium sp. So ce1504 TaxID=3133337 RepID=UPI003F60CC85
MRSPIACLAALGALIAPLAWSSPSRADASAWTFVGAGAVGWKQGESDLVFDGALSCDVGVGTTPDAPVIVGGLMRATPILDSGIDLALLARVATRGFQAGQLGLALDAGGYRRFWGAGSTGVAGALTLGAPLGISLSLQGSYGTDNAMAFAAIAGIDLLRLTVYRQSLLPLWPNPFPAQQRGQDVASR